jgi:hypothetical protein
LLQASLPIVEQSWHQTSNILQDHRKFEKVFRKFECFPHPNPYVQCGKRPLPRLLELYPNAKDQIVSVGIKNLGTLSIESVHDFIITSILPRLASTWQMNNVPIVKILMLLELILLMTNQQSISF